ncbi:hypothetical protein F4561_003566 [Lipingzhangella halophila]|uniref:FAD-binding domain-containing protein n=1 Tax=Lipingzhangella halophila TaxID=1783352 RepID=A0A7W7W3G2_9ACTN|nr:FAD-dependent monooxygenase [Lipingzhangella halophila]MBB4932746.1 hypothetical protein [Lipingzhangella halophila]
MVENYRTGPLIVGDSHVHPSAGGQRMNSGIPGADNLGWKLAGVVGGGALPGLLDTSGLSSAPPPAPGAVRRCGGAAMNRRFSCA